MPFMAKNEFLVDVIAVEVDIRRRVCAGDHESDPIFKSEREFSLQTLHNAGNSLDHDIMRRIDVYLLIQVLL